MLFTKRVSAQAIYERFFPESERNEQPEREASDKAGVETCICNYGALFFFCWWIIAFKIRVVVLWTIEPLFISSVHKKLPKLKNELPVFLTPNQNFQQTLTLPPSRSEKPVAAAVWLTERLIDYTLLLIKDPAAVLLDVIYKFPASLARQRLQLLYSRILTGGWQKCFL